MNISVVVPFYNVEVYIDACCRALLCQTYPADRYDIIMVDNKSTDRSATIVASYPRIRLMSEQRQSSYAARNRGIGEACGSVVAFVDSDCVPSPDWLERIAEAMTDSGVQIAQGSRRPGRESWALSLLGDYEARKAAYVFASHVPELYYGYTNNMAVRRSVFDQVGLFPEVQRGGDVILVQRVIAQYGCGGIRYRPDMRIRHLELTAARAWFHKMYVYGRSSRWYSTIVPVRPLNLGERLVVFKSTVTGARYSTFRAILLLLLLIVGVIHYELGRLVPGGKSETI